MSAPEGLTVRQRELVEQATETLILTAAAIAAGMPHVDLDSREGVYQAAYSRTKVRLGMALAVVDELAVVPAVRADQLVALADWMDERLDAENYDRQAVAESGVTQLRELAALAGAPSPPGVTLTAEQLGTVLGALGDASSFRRYLGMQSCGYYQAFEQACDPHRDDLHAAADYDDLAARLLGGVAK